MFLFCLRVSPSPCLRFRVTSKDCLGSKLDNEKGVVGRVGRTGLQVVHKNCWTSPTRKRDPSLWV